MSAHRYPDSLLGPDSPEILAFRCKVCGTWVGEMEDTPCGGPRSRSSVGRIGYSENLRTYSKPENDRSPDA